MISIFLFFFSVDNLLNERTGDPEELLTSLGFVSAEVQEDSFMRIPERFLMNPSVAPGISLEGFLNTHPDLREMVMLKRSFHQPAKQPGMFGNFNTYSDAVNHMIDVNVPPRYLESFQKMYKMDDESLQSLQTLLLGQEGDESTKGQCMTASSTLTLKPLNTNEADGAEVSDGPRSPFLDLVNIPALDWPAPVEAERISPENAAVNNNNNNILAKLSQLNQGCSGDMMPTNPISIVIHPSEVTSPVLSLPTSDKAERPDSLDLAVIGADDCGRSWSSGSTMTPSSSYLYYKTSGLAPGETLV